MKKLKLFYVLITASLFFACGTDEADTDATGNIVADFTFTNNEGLFEFTNLSEGATSYRWDFGDLSFYCDKKNPKYRYTKIGGQIDVTLTAMNDAGQETYITKTITAPVIPNVSIAIDGKFTDWMEVPVLYQEADGVSVKKIKIWGRGDNINVYLEGNKKMKMEIVDIFINADGGTTTGFVSWQWPQGSGAEFLFEGPLLTGTWGAFYQHIDPAGGWGWAALAGSGANLKASAPISIDVETNGIEFSIPKTQLGALGTSIGLAFTELTSGWAAVGSFPKVTGTSKFVKYDLPLESTSLCQ